MRFYVYSLFNDTVVRNSHVFWNTELQLMNIRDVLHDNDCHYSMVLLSQHTSNQKIIDYIRQFNIIIPIYILSKNIEKVIGANGHITISNFNANEIKSKFKRYPQQHVWDYVFTFDKLNREKLACG